MNRWKTIGDPDIPAPRSEPGMAALFKEIRSTVSQEAQIVKAVFPDPAAVLQVFLQRVFAQVVRPLAFLSILTGRYCNIWNHWCSELLQYRLWPYCGSSISHIHFALR